jgi:hypothetical protein
VPPPWRGAERVYGRDLDLATPEGAYYGGMETLRAKRESAVKSARVREAADRNARAGKRAGGGWRWFGYVRVYANPDEPDHRKQVIMREDPHPVESEARRDAAQRLLDQGETIGSVIRDWTLQEPVGVVCVRQRPRYRVRRGRDPRRVA